MNLADCYTHLLPLLGPNPEPFEVLERADKHRQYWRPDRVRVVLLAESHVYTTEKELEHYISPSILFPADLPKDYVRLVYCLGYGENGVLDRSITTTRNSGTPQFWKIFYSCLNLVKANTDFAPVQRSRTPSLTERIANKMALLNGLRDNGIWLLDASIAALYTPGASKPKPSTVRKSLASSWEYYVGPLIASIQPVAIICIGLGVAKILAGKIGALNCRWGVVPQPNARLPASEHTAIFRIYYEVCRGHADSCGLTARYKTAI